MRRLSTCQLNSTKMSKAAKSKSLTSELHKLRVVTKFEQEISNNLQLMSKDMHEQRLKSMRETADKLKDDSWKYLSIEKLLGLQ